LSAAWSFAGVLARAKIIAAKRHKRNCFSMRFLSVNTA
jgi:hypothetical protein